MPMPAAFFSQPRSADFGARLVRGKGRTLAMLGRRRHRGRRALVLIAAVAVPALAAPGDWGAFAIGNAGKAAIAIEPMPFERGGDSFPGSAFYYLVPDPARDLPTAPGMAAAAGFVDPAGGPIARAMRVDFSGVDRGRALDCLTAAVYYEAASESDQGQRAVAQVVLNRVAHPAFPKTVCGVVFQGSERTTGCQFSFTCDGALGRKPSRMFWDRARGVAAAALSGTVEPSVGLATHYHTFAVSPVWSRQMNLITTVGAHMFFRWRGRAGEAGAFNFAYRGGEPLPVPNPRSTAALAVADPALDPLALQRAYEAALAASPAAAAPAQPAAATGRAPAYSAEVETRGGDALYRGDRLPEANTVRPEYRNSGAWIAQPGG